jgi:hypothetical protein
LTKAVSQPCTNVEEFNRKKHWVGGTYGHPYTMFDRYNGKTFEQTIFAIRENLIKEKKDTTLKFTPILEAYCNAIDNAILPMPTDNGMDANAASKLPAGIYYYSIVLDNNSVKTKMMVVL